MIDSVIAGTGNSRYLRTSISASTTWEDALTMLRAGTFPIDLAGINISGFTTLGTALNSDTLLKSAIITALGLEADATPSDAWEAVLALIDTKQDTLTFDDTPTSGSTNPVTSEGIYDAIDNAVDDAIEAATTRTATITLPTLSWSGSDPYTQTVTLSGYTVTANTRVDIACDYNALNAMAADGVTTLYFENSNGTITAYSVGAAPSSDVTVFANIYETISL